MGVIIGIDLGTTNSLAAVFRNGHYELIPNAFGDVLTPSVISVDENNTVYVGKVAKERLVTHPEQTVSVFKRSMGTDKKWLLGGKTYTPEELSALVLKRLKEDAEAYLGEEVEEAVVSVPAYFGDNARTATREAGRIAGMKVERIVNEPSAAALACMYTENVTEAKYLVFDFGGGTLDVSLVDYFENIVQIQAVSGNRNLGGSDFDMAIARAFCKENQLKYDGLEEAERQLILKAAERAKRDMSVKDETDMIVSTEKGQTVMHLTRNELARIIGPGLTHLAEPINRVLKDAGVGIEGINSVILVGGSSKMPLVQQYLKFLLPKAKFQVMNPDQVIAIGAGIFAGIMSRETEIKDMILTDICPFSLGTAIINHSNPNSLYMSTIIPRNTALPVSKSHTYVPVSDITPAIEFGVYQGEELYAEENTKLGNLRIEVPVGIGANRVVEATYTYDINGLLHVKLVALGSGVVREATFYHGEATTDQELVKRAKSIADMTVAAAENEENMLVLERAKALYVQIENEIKAELQHRISAYETILAEGSMVDIAKARRNFKKFLDTVEERFVVVEVEDQSVEDFLSFLDDLDKEEEDEDNISFSDIENKFYM